MPRQWLESVWSFLMAAIDTIRLPRHPQPVTKLLLLQGGIHFIAPALRWDVCIRASKKFSPESCDFWVDNVKGSDDFYCQNYKQLVRSWTDQPTDVWYKKKSLRFQFSLCKSEYLMQ